jgi:hypothetical protein
MSADRNEALVTKMLRAIEARELGGLPALYDPGVSFQWPPGLPYGGNHQGKAVETALSTFQTIWEPLQLTPELRRMDAEVVGTGGDGRVIVRYWWRGGSPRAGKHEAETLAEYVVRDDLLLCAQMFHFDLLGVLAFPRRAGVDGVAIPVAC